MNISQQITKNKSFLNNILITMVIGVVINFLNYLFNIFLARELVEVDFSIYNAALGIITLVQIPAIAIQTAITKKVASNKNFNLEKFKVKSILQLLVIALVLSSLFYAFGDYIADVANISKEYIPALTLVVFAGIVNPVAKGFLLGLEKILAFNLVLLLDTILKFGFGFYAIHISNDLSHTMLAFAIPMLISTVLVLPLVKTKSTVLPSPEPTLDYKNISLIFTTFLLLNIPYTLDLILVNPDVRASYGALGLIGKIVYFASITIASVMISKLANSKKELRQKTLLISLVVSALTGIGISFVFFIFPKDIVGIMFDGMYLEIVEYLVPYCIAMTAYAISYLVITSLLIEDSYMHILFLIALSVIQVLLYMNNNVTLYDAFLNQVIVYGILFIFVLVILIFKVFKRDGKNYKGET